MDKKLLSYNGDNMEYVKRGDSASRDGVLISHEEYERLQKDREILDRAEQILRSIPKLSLHNGSEWNDYSTKEGKRN